MEEDEFPAGLTESLDAEPGSGNAVVVAKEEPAVAVEDSPKAEDSPAIEVVAEESAAEVEEEEEPPEANQPHAKAPRLRVKDDRAAQIARLTNAGLSFEEAVTRVGSTVKTDAAPATPEEGSPEAIAVELETIQAQLNAHAEREDMITPEYQALVDKKLDLKLAQQNALNERKAAEREDRQRHNEDFQERYTSILDEEIAKYPDADKEGTPLSNMCQDIHDVLRTNSPEVNERYKDLVKFRGKPEFGAELLKTAAQRLGIQPTSTATGQGAVTTPNKSTTTTVAAKPKGIPVAGAKTPIAQPVNAATQEADKIRALRGSEDEGQTRKALNALFGEDEDENGFGNQLR